MMKKSIILLLIVIVVILSCFSVYFFKLAGSESIGTIPIGDDNKEPYWDSSKNEISDNISLQTVDGKDYNNLAVEIEFFKDNGTVLVEKYRIYGLNSESGKISFSYTKKLPDKPDTYVVTLLN
ncbi:MAG: hypothetical protein ACRC1M_07930 [Methanobacteriaceae archaeon]